MNYTFNGLKYEIIRYGIVGGIAFIFDYCTMFVLTEFFGVHYLVSAIAGFCLGTVINYILSQKWVFRNSKTNGVHSFVVFTVVGIIGLGITELFMWLGVDILGFNYKFIKLIVTGMVFLWNYVIRKLMVFNESKLAA